MEVRIMGLKADLKKELKSKGITHIQLDNGRKIKLQNAKTADLIRTLSTIK